MGKAVWLSQLFTREGVRGDSGASGDSVAEEWPVGVVPLCGVGVGDEVVVYGISSGCPDYQQRRLCDLGFVAGSVVRIDLVSPFGNPIAYEVHGASIALRRDQAAWIMVMRREQYRAKEQGDGNK